MKRYFSLIFLTLFSLPLTAQELDTRPYFIFSVGSSMIDNSPLNADSKDAAFLLGGGWDFSEHLATELSYVNLGSVKYSGAITEIQSSSLTASLVPYQQFDRFRLYGRVGAGLWSTDLSGTPSVQKNGFGPIIGGGVEYLLGREYVSWSIRLDWTRHLQVGDENVSFESDIDTVLLGFSVRH